MKRWLALAALALASAAAGWMLRGPTSASPPRADPDALACAPALSAPRFVVPSLALPPEVRVQAANNNVDLALHDGRLYLGWRTAPKHFASRDARMYVISTDDWGESFCFELEVALGADVREPRFLSFQGRLVFHWFEAGTDPFAFEPRRMWRSVRGPDGTWSEPETWGRPGEIAWAFAVHAGVAWQTSYVARGGVYGAGAGDVDVLFQRSDDGLAWSPVSGDDAVVYTGGATECAFAFDDAGDLWAVTRNEQGDKSGLGSHVAHAPAASLWRWSFPEQCSPDRYDSPRMFAHAHELYLLARRDLGGPYGRLDAPLPFAAEKTLELLRYSLRPKRTALYRVDRERRRVEHLLDLPSAGDTAFPAVVQTGPSSFLVANYTSPLADPDRSWISGQLSSQGTGIYLVDLCFLPRR